MSVLIIRALLFCVCIRAPDFWKLPYEDLEPRRREPTQTSGEYQGPFGNTRSIFGVIEAE